MAAVYRSFRSEQGFCWNCGSILPMQADAAVIKCFMCKFEYGPEAFGAMENHYEIPFNNLSDYQRDYQLKMMQANLGAKAGGPIVERKCSKCGNETMSYQTLQLRSADEGQTVFYTCTRCGFKETENS